MTTRLCGKRRRTDSMGGMRSPPSTACGSGVSNPVQRCRFMSRGHCLLDPQAPSGIVIWLWWTRLPRSEGVRARVD